MSKGHGNKKTQSAFRFHIMAAKFAVRDFLSPRMKILEELDIRSAHCVLDYGCGPGGYVVPLADLVGPEGKIYALDCNPLAIKTVERLVVRRKLSNVEVICSSCHTALPDNFLDRILFYDILHYPMDNITEIFAEFHKTLKPDGLLAVHDHHLKEAELLDKVAATGLFKLHYSGKSYCFVKTEQQ